MKLAVRSLMLVSIVTTFAYTQTLPHFQHIVIIVQENRTPDNLFGSGPVGSMCGYPDPFEPGVDIQDGGPAEGKGTICDSQIHLLTGFDPNHSYENGWLVQWHNGAMDGACNTTVFNPNNVILPYCPQYSYVIRSEVQPYFDIATNYGFANYRSC
jgi:phospholipase C